MWMQGKLAPYTQTAITPAVVPQVGAPVLPGGTLPTPASEKEFSLLETSKIQGACGLTDAQWDTDLPGFYTRMLEEGRTTAWVKALLEDTFRPNNKYSLSAVYLQATAEMAKNLKELNYGYSNNLSYDTISPFAVIGVLMATR
jgi:hypothetical protein